MSGNTGGNQGVIAVPVVAIPVTTEQVESLKNCLVDTIQKYRVKRNRNKAGAIAIQSAMFLFSISTTVLIGWQLGVGADDISTKTGITNAALISSALAAGTMTIDKFFDFKALWVAYNVSIANLNSALAKINYLASLKPENLLRIQLDEIFVRYESVCANMDKTYLEVRNAKDE